MCEPSLAWGCFTSWSWITTNDLSCNHHSNRFRDIKIWYSWSSETSSSVPCWECLSCDGGDDARCQNGGSASCSRDLAPLDFLLPKLYYFFPRTGRRGKIIIDERRFVNNTTGNSKHTCCPHNKFKPSSLSRVSCGYVRRYHSVYVWSYFLQSVNFILFLWLIISIFITHWYSFFALIGVSQMQLLKLLAALYVWHPRCYIAYLDWTWPLESSCVLRRVLTFSHKFKFWTPDP